MKFFLFYDHYLIIFLDYVLMPLSVSAIFVGTIIAIYQDDIKKLLAYSSIAQIGYITLAFSMNDQSGITAGFIHIFNHALIKGGLFMAIGYFAFSSQDRVTLSSINGYGQKYPITSFALLICGVSLIGIPLTNGFVSKLYLFQALYYNHMFITIALVAISSALAVIYFWKIVESLWFSSIKTEVVSEDPAIYIPLWIVAISIIIFGVFSAPIVELANMASINLFGGISN